MLTSKEDHKPTGGEKKKLKDYNLCNTGKPINGGVCE
jgi:hypothetical protein